ncbi:MAG: threonylcarbamoyl-AMP synthase [Bacteroidetes bacterium]|nr:threonylcarbamoyl-AMP synthase [Bacteroidota bacterium]
MLLKVDSNNPEESKIRYIAECLNDNGVIIYPTDTVYGIGCNIRSPKAIEKICRIKGIKVEKANFSFIFYDLSHLSDFTKQIDTPTYKIMRKALPGPFTFILHAGSEIPKIFRSRKKTIGIRVPDNEICRSIVKELESPLMNSSLHNEEDEISEYLNDPEEIHNKYHKLVDIVVDGGFGNLIASTVVDCSTGGTNIIRQGLGIIEGY